MHLRARDESGFGMLELLMAMVMLNVGILAVVAAFSSGNAALYRANRISTSGALANKQMEAYRGLKYDNIVFVTSEWTSAIADSTYTGDTVYQQNMASPVAPKALVATVSDVPGERPGHCLRSELHDYGRRPPLLSGRHVSVFRHADFREPAAGGHRRHSRPELPDAPVGARLVDVRSVDRKLRARPTESPAGA